MTALPVLDCLRQAARVTYRQSPQVLHAFWPVYLLEVAFHAMDGNRWQMLPGVLSALAAIPCACAWHCHIIAGTPVRLALGQREWRFFKVQLSIAVVMGAVLFCALVVGGLVGLLHWAVPLVGAVLGVLVGSWIIAPMLLGLPAAALGQNRRPAELEAMSAPHRFRLTVLIMMVPLGQSLLQLATPMLGGGAPVLKLALAVICWPLGIGMLSLAYVWLGQTQSEAMET